MATKTKSREVSVNRKALAVLLEAVIESDHICQNHEKYGQTWKEEFMDNPFSNAPCIVCESIKTIKFDLENN